MKPERLQRSDESCKQLWNSRLKIARRFSTKPVRATQRCVRRLNPS